MVPTAPLGLVLRIWGLNIVWDRPHCERRGRLALEHTPLGRVRLPGNATAGSGRGSGLYNEENRPPHG